VTRAVRHAPVETCGAGAGVHRAIAQAQSLAITADAGGSNGARLRLWKWELQRFGNRTGLAITVCQFPPGTSKWNRIEHRLFSHIAMNWRGTPLVNLATIVSLIGSTQPLRPARPI
jgi:Rhodopirellula transposase DDE domain